LFGVPDGALPARQPRPHPESTMKVLVVDDEQTVVDDVCTYLARRHIKAVGACGAVHACEALDKDGPFDVVLADMRTDLGTGVDVIRACNRLGGRRPTILLITGGAQSEQVADSIKLRIASVISRPRTFLALLQARFGSTALCNAPDRMRGEATAWFVRPFRWLIRRSPRAGDH
jgi:DNA-binding NtrC family response regulator